MLNNAVFFTARKRSLGQGNMFTGVCLSTGGCLLGGGGPVWGAPSPGGCLLWGCLMETPRWLLLRGGMHPTGMHSCFKKCYMLTRPHTGSHLQRVRLQRAPGYQEQISLHKYHWLQCLKKFGYDEQRLVTSSFFCIILLVVSGTQCTWIESYLFTEFNQARLKSFLSWIFFCSENSTIWNHLSWFRLGGGGGEGKNTSFWCIWHFCELFFRKHNL